MASTIKKATFDDLYHTFATILDHIDKALAKEGKKKLKGDYTPPSNIKTFLQGVERNAIKKTAKELDMGVSTARERWKTLSLPLPFYAALESNEISYSKAKAVSGLNFDPEDDRDVDVASHILEKVKDLPVKEVKAVAEEMYTDAKLWSPSDVVMRRLAEQYEISE